MSYFCIPFTFPIGFSVNTIVFFTKNKTKYLVGHMKRYDNGILFLKKNLRKINLGKLISVYYQSFIGDSYSNPFEYFKHSLHNCIVFRIPNSLIAFSEWQGKDRERAQDEEGMGLFLSL